MLVRLQEMISKVLQKWCHRSPFLLKEAWTWERSGRKGMCTVWMNTPRAFGLPAILENVCRVILHITIIFLWAWTCLGILLWTRSSTGCFYLHLLDGCCFPLAFWSQNETNFVPRGPQTPLWNGLGRGETLRGVFIHQPDVTCRYDILVTAFTDTYSPINSRWREQRHTNGRILSQWHYSDLGNLNNRSLFHISLQLAARNFLLKFSTEILDKQIKEKKQFLSYFQSYF